MENSSVDNEQGDHSPDGRPRPTPSANFIHRGTRRKISRDFFYVHEKVTVKKVVNTAVGKRHVLGIARIIFCANNVCVSSEF